MKLIRVNLKERSYNILVGKNAIRRLGGALKKLKIGSDAYVLTNASVKQKFGKMLQNTLSLSGFNVKFKVVPDAETSKSLGVAAAVLMDLAEYDRQRKIFIVALGGGVIGDLAGFVASVYKRGVPVIQIPTTLLAQVDSGIGGKTALDLRQGKNLVGSFYQPKLVLNDIGFLSTLALPQIRSGLAEIVKYGIIKDARLFAFIEKNYQDILGLKPFALQYIVERSSAIKARIVSCDENEIKGIRTILNFGHTIGHAIETASKYSRLSHGEAVALGMLIAADISRRLRLTDETTIRRIEGVIEKIGLPRRIEKLSLKQIVDAHYHDKKFSGKINRFVLITRIGKTKIVNNVPISLIEEAIKVRL